ncbi:MAG: glycoside hydrolase [Eubacterium sp.]|nr:glycoside hydrolase [Eubacterium sp.]
MDSLKKIERIVKIALAVMLLVSVTLITAWLLSDNKNGKYDKTVEVGEQTADNSNSELAGKLDLLPDKCTLNQDLSGLIFTDDNGKKVTVSDFKGRVVVLNFWASWCPYCNKELDKAARIKAMLGQYTDVEYLLINKLDNSKETKKQAQHYLQQNKISFPAFYDEGLKVYNQLGLKVIPTTLVIDKRGMLKTWHAGKDMEPGVLQAMIDYTINGGSSETLSFIENELSNEAGGVNTNYLPEKGSSLQNTDVLCESQGLLMEYAVNTSNKKLFEKSFNYFNLKMRKDPLAAWVVTDKGPSRVNSAIDDLRIFRVLYEADELWGGYSQLLDNYEKALYRFNTQNQKLVSQYDFKYRKKANTLKLCFADFEALKILASKNSSWEQVYQNNLTIVNEGYIGDQFPMYYAEYDYAKQAYKHDAINMAEEMVTLLHLSKTGQLKPQTLTWLKNMVEGEGIYARYKPDGTVAAGYRYESTAIYGLVSMIANNAGDKDLANRALARMEAMRIFDSDKKVNGAFGNVDGTGIYSFDQCIGLLSYSTADEEIRNIRNEEK